MRIIGNEAVRQILDGREDAVIDLVADAYRRHDEGLSVLPHSVFLRFPEQPRDRIIGLPGFLGGERPVAGLKWISSFPGNLDAGLERASAAIILNSLTTGRPEVLVEGSLISSARTAASAALGARLLSGDRRITGVSLIGCGVINRQILRFLAADNPELAEVTVHDTDPDRAEAFAGAGLVPNVKFGTAATLEQALGAHDVISFATTAATPYTGLTAARPDAVVLHISLRDLSVAAVLGSRNVVDDPDHVCRERTSLHLAEGETGDRAFIESSIGRLLLGSDRLRARDGRPVVYSPFGLGVLDLALAQYVRDEAVRRGLGISVDDFLPGPHA